MIFHKQQQIFKESFSLPKVYLEFLSSVDQLAAEVIRHLFVVPVDFLKLDSLHVCSKRNVE